MYGMIHKSVRDMVVMKFGEECWQKICSEAGVSDEHFLSMESYPDEVVYDIVGAATKILELTPEQVLDAFGEHFVTVTLNKNYQNMLKTYGKNSFELLENLNHLHTTIKTTFSDYKPPMFSVEHVADDKIDLTYQSIRSGLTPFVHGLLRGMAEFYGESLTIADEKQLPAEQGEKTQFRVVRESA